MNIRYKLTIQFSLIVLWILLFLIIGIYSISYSYRENDYNIRLRDRAKTVANLYLGVKEVNEALFKIIDRNTLALYKEEFSILDDHNKLIYSNTEKPFSDWFALSHVRENGEFRYKKKERDALGLVYLYHNRKYLIMASAYDYFGIAKIKYMRNVLIICFFLGLLVAEFAGFIFAGRALRPISSIVNQVQLLTISNLNLRVDEGNKKDEIAQLAITFNRMLQGLEEAFILQRDFVSNAAHELRTPFAVLLAEIDYSLLHERERNYYITLLNKQRLELKRLSSLSDGLLDLARLSYITTSIELKTVRIDELLVESCNGVVKNKPDYCVEVDFTGLPENEKLLYVSCNEQLLKIAVTNLIINACKFSDDKSVTIQFEVRDNFIILSFMDRGIGILPEEIDRIFQPFFRGKNTQFIAGYGIGLALTSKIVEIHNGFLTVESDPGKHTTFYLKIPNRMHF
jgi:signal transduction histidine kinase